MGSLLTWVLPRVGGPAPPFSVRDLSGAPVTLVSLLAGRGALLLNFFFLACKPCRDGFAALDSLQQRHAAAGLTVAAISRGDSAKALREFAATSRPGFAVLSASDDAPLFADYRVLVYPSSVLVDAAGHIVWRCAGSPKAAALDAAISRLLQPPDQRR